MNPGEAITSNSGYLTGSYGSERQPNKRFLYFIIAGVAIFVVLIGVIAFMSLGGSKLLSGIPVIEKEKFESFKNYIYYGKTMVEDPAKIEDSTKMYIYNLTAGPSYLNSRTANNNALNADEYAAKLKELYQDLNIDTEKYKDYKEYDVAVRLVAIYVDPIAYYREAVQQIKPGYNEKDVATSISNNFKVDDNYVTWSILAKNLESYYKYAANLYSFYYKNGCANNGLYEESCIQSRNSSIIREFNVNQGLLQSSSDKTFSDSTRKMVTDGIYKMLEKLEESVK